MRAHRPPRAGGPLFAFVAIGAICVLIETVLQFGDAGVFGAPRFRLTVYEYGGFYPGLLGDWTPNFPLQPATMFLTYGFLHAGLVHLLVNMITLAALAPRVGERAGTWKSLAVYGLSLLGGAVGYALIGDPLRPMVGASGALFGLAGAILAWEYVDRFTFDEGLWPVGRAVLWLLFLNVALYFAMNRQLAWEAHLGGFVAGWVAALLVDPRGRPAADD